MRLLREGAEDIPRRMMKVRLRSSWGRASSIATTLIARRVDSELSALLYDELARPSDRHRYAVLVDPTIDLDSIVGDGPIQAEVLGWPAPGRAIVIDAMGVSMLSLTPCKPPLLGRRLGTSFPR